MKPIYHEVKVPNDKYGTDDGIVMKWMYDKYAYACRNRRFPIFAD